MSHSPKVFAFSRVVTLTCILILSWTGFVYAAGAAPSVERLSIDARAPGRPFPHFWETMFGSGLAMLVLHANYERDLQIMRSATAIGYVR